MFRLLCLCSIATLALSTLQTSDAVACAAPEVSLTVESIDGDIPDCFLLDENGFGLLYWTNTCDGRPVKVEQLRCEGYPCTPLDIYPFDAPFTAIEREFREGIASILFYRFTIGAPDMPLEQSFDDPSQLQSFEISIKEESYGEDIECEDDWEDWEDHMDPIDDPKIEPDTKTPNKPTRDERTDSVDPWPTQADDSENSLGCGCASVEQKKTPLHLLIVMMLLIGAMMARRVKKPTD